MGEHEESNVWTGAGLLAQGGEEVVVVVAVVVVEGPVKEEGECN